MVEKANHTCRVGATWEAVLAQLNEKGLGDVTKPYLWWTNVMSPITNVPPEEWIVVSAKEGPFNEGMRPEQESWRGGRTF